MSNNDRSNLVGMNHSVSEVGRDYLGVYEEYVRPTLAELVGVTLFVCVGCLSVQQSGGGAAEGAVPFSGIGIAVGHGFTIALLVVALGDVSGGHFNPAVTVGVLLAGAITPVKAVIYILAQLVGGVAGAGLSKAIMPSSVYSAIGGGAHDLGAGVSPGQGILCEIVLTTVLVLTVLMAAVDPNSKTTLAPLAIGFAVTVDILAGVLVTGASMNPARSFGPAVMISANTTKFWNYHYVYWVGPGLGAIVAGAWYRIVGPGLPSSLTCAQLCAETPKDAITSSEVTPARKKDGGVLVMDVWSSG